jgi:hypothetical protein
MSKNTIAASFLALVAFVLTLIISPWHHGGDQIVYIKVYSEIPSYRILDAFIYYRGQIAALDVVHFFYTYLCANIGLSKDVAMALANAALFYLASKILITYAGASLSSLIFLLSNYYLLAFSFTLERYKFSVIFLMLAICWAFRKDFRAWIAVLIGVLAHFSSVIPVALWLFCKRISASKISSASELSRKQLRFVFFGILILVAIYKDDVFHKIEPYFLNDDRENIALSVLKTSIFMFLAVCVSGRLLIIHLAVFLPLLIFSSVIEPARINFFAYMFLLYFIYNSRPSIKINVINFFISAYFSARGIIYLVNIYERGG